MKTKVSNQLNILLTTMALLLLFVIGFYNLGHTNSWLVTSDTIGFQLGVQEIQITIKQGERKVLDKGYILLNTNLIEADTEYLTNTLSTTIDPETGDETTTGENNSVTITNDEEGLGYYIRFQAIAVINGVSYNINHFIKTSDFLNRKGADNSYWMYSVDAQDRDVAMSAGQTLTMMQDVQFSQNFINQVQGQYFRLYLFVEGSATGVFS